MKTHHYTRDYVCYFGKPEGSCPSDSYWLIPDPEVWEWEAED